MSAQTVQSRAVRVHLTAGDRHKFPDQLPCSKLGTPRWSADSVPIFFATRQPEFTAQLPVDSADIGSNGRNATPLTL